MWYPCGTLCFILGLSHPPMLSVWAPISGNREGSSTVGVENFKVSNSPEKLFYGGQSAVCIACGVMFCIHKVLLLDNKFSWIDSAFPSSSYHFPTCAIKLLKLTLKLKNALPLRWRLLADILKTTWVYAHLNKMLVLCWPLWLSFCLLFLKPFGVCQIEKGKLSLLWKEFMDASGQCGLSVVNWYIDTWNPFVVFNKFSLQRKILRNEIII